MTELIKTSKHYINNFANLGKIDKLASFLSHYRSATEFFIDYLWSNRLDWSMFGKAYTLDVKNNLLDCPNFFSTKNLIESPLSARALKCAATQACGIVKSVIERKRKLEWIKAQLIVDNKSTINIQKAIDKITYSKPELNRKFGAELNSICANWIATNKFFNGFLVLSSLGKSFGKISIPIKFNKHSNKLRDNLNATQMKSFLIFDKAIDIRWSYQVKPIKKGTTVGMDTGLNNIYYLSDGQHSTADQHGHSLKTIANSLVRKKPGSKAFARAQEHRTNHINWSINQIDFSNVRQANIELVHDYGRGKRQSKQNSHWGISTINKKLETMLIDLGVLVNWRESNYMSQRCHRCGYVSPENRQREEFRCGYCGSESHADLNAARNHLEELRSVRGFGDVLKQARRFFYFREGLFAEDGSELTVPNSVGEVIDANAST